MCIVGNKMMSLMEMTNQGMHNWSIYSVELDQKKESSMEITKNLSNITLMYLHTTIIYSLFLFYKVLATFK